MSKKFKILVFTIFLNSYASQGKDPEITSYEGLPITFESSKEYQEAIRECTKARDEYNNSTEPSRTAHELFINAANKVSTIRDVLVAQQNKSANLKKSANN